MENVIKVVRDIFSMDFDVIIPVSGGIIAIAVGFLLFAIRYFSFIKNRKKYEKRQKNSHTVTLEAEQEEKHKEDPPEAEATEGAVDLPDKTPTDNEVNAL